MSISSSPSPMPPPSAPAPSPQHVFQSEMTPDGEQTLIPGVVPVTMRDRLEARIAAPLLPRKSQKPMDIGLFDEIGRNQLELF